MSVVKTSMRKEIFQWVLALLVVLGGLAIWHWGPSMQKANAQIDPIVTHTEPCS